MRSAEAKTERKDDAEERLKTDSDRSVSEAQFRHENVKYGNARDTIEKMCQHGGVGVIVRNKSSPVSERGNPVSNKLTGRIPEKLCRTEIWY